jgi:hypothetical protein
MEVEGAGQKRHFSNQHDLFLSNKELVNDKVCESPPRFIVVHNTASFSAVDVLSYQETTLQKISVLPASKKRWERPPPKKKKKNAGNCHPSVCCYRRKNQCGQKFLPSF